VSVSLNEKSNNLENIVFEDHVLDYNVLEDIVSLAKKGDSMAYEYLINRFEPLVKRMSRRYFLPKESNEDLIQEGKIAIFKAIRTYKTEFGIPFASFVRMVIARKFKQAITMGNAAKHQVFNMAYSLDKTNDLSIPTDNLLVSSAQNYQSDPGQVVVAKLHYKFIVNSLMAEFTDLEQQVFHTYFMKQMKPAEISNIFGITTKCIDNTVTRIKKKALKYKESA